MSLGTLLWYSLTLNFILTLVSWCEKLLTLEDLAEFLQLLLFTHCFHLSHHYALWTCFVIDTMGIILVQSVSHSISEKFIKECFILFGSPWSFWVFSLNRDIKGSPQTPNICWRSKRRRRREKKGQEEEKTFYKLKNII